MRFEIKNTQVENIKRLILYTGDDIDESIGYKVERKDLNILYTILRDLFKDDND